ncbi:hypothetical protein C0J52_21757, partial [Blattella germanica]
EKLRRGKLLLRQRIIRRTKSLEVRNEDLEGSLVFPEMAWVLSLSQNFGAAAGCAETQV